MVMPSPSLPLQAVLFDRDDTLAYTDHGVYREAATWAAQQFNLHAPQVGGAMQEQWQARALTWWDLRTPDDETRFWADYGDELAARLGISSRDAATFMARYPYEAFMKPFASARDVLTALRALGLKIGVLSNTLPSIDRTLQQVGLADLIDVAVATCSLGVHKPDLGPYRYAAQALGVQPTQVLFIDDKPENVEAARALGMHARLIDHAAGTPGALHDLPGVLTVAQTLTGGPT